MISFLFSAVLSGILFMTYYINRVKTKSVNTTIISFWILLTMDLEIITLFQLLLLFDDVFWIDTANEEKEMQGVSYLLLYSGLLLYS